MNIRNTFTLNPSRTYVLIVLSAICYFILAYYTQRYQSTNLFVLFSLVFGAYLLILRTELSTNQLVFSGYFFRLIFIIAIPALSDDFYRFIWDGKLTLNGINPYSILPTQIINSPTLVIKGLNHELFEKLNSPDVYSMYPPASQFLFWVSSLVSGDNMLINVVMLRIFILAAEFGTIAFMRKLFRIYGFEEKFTAIYFLNPLVILELTGNLHFEAFLIFLVIASIYLFKKNKYIFAGALFGLAVSVKLIPLILLPFVYKRIDNKSAVKFYLSGLVITISTFIPLFNEYFISGFTKNVTLYFQKFEFNASIFYVVREVGLLIKGFDIIHTAGIILTLIAIVGIVILAIKEKKEKNLLLGIFIWPLLIFCVFSSFVQPWYVTPILAFAIFSRYRFAMVWSFLIFLTYAGYHENGFTENLVIVLIEYLILFGVVIYELINQRGKVKVY